MYFLKNQVRALQFHFTSKRVTGKLNGAILSYKNPPTNATALVRCQPLHTYYFLEQIDLQMPDWKMGSTVNSLHFRQIGKYLFHFRGNLYKQIRRSITIKVMTVKVTELIIGRQYAVELEYPCVIPIYNSTDDQIYLADDVNLYCLFVYPRW